MTISPHDHTFTSGSISVGSTDPPPRRLTVIRRSLEINDLDVVRSSEGRTIVARALTYNVPYEVSDDGGLSYYHETWRRGVFDKSITQRAGRIPLLVTHDRRSLPIGATIGVEPDAKAFIFRAKVSNVRAGDEALELVNDGALTGISVGARILNSKRVQRGVERIEARLEELSLTPFAQMADGNVLAVRALVDEEEETTTETHETEEQTDTPALDEARTYLEGLERP